jgi:UPF0716 family protein affecting phage T7 exclusion
MANKTLPVLLAMYGSPVQEAPVVAPVPVEMVVVVVVVVVVLLVLLVLVLEVVELVVVVLVGRPPVPGPTVGLVANSYWLGPVLTKSRGMAWATRSLVQKSMIR